MKEAFGIPELYWTLYWGSAYGYGDNGLPITRWYPSWDDEINGENCKCLLLQKSTQLSDEYFVWPYSPDNADSLHLVFPKTEIIDEERSREVVSAISQTVLLNEASGNAIDAFLDEASKSKVEADQFVAIAEALTSVFIGLQAISIETALGRVYRLGEAVDESKIEDCFSGTIKLYLKAAAYLKRLLDAYETQVELGATVSERSEVLSYIGAFNGNILPAEVPTMPDYVNREALLEPPEALFALRSRLEKDRYELRNNPDGKNERKEEKDDGASGDEPCSEALVEVGDTFCLGKYYWSGKEDARPLEWEVIDLKGTHALCVSRYLIDCLHFNEFEGDVTWETSTIRGWLNDEFADIAFDADDRRKISGARISNEDNQEHGTPGGNTTKDRIFLLSESEVNDFINKETDNPEPTPYAESQGANQWWWLRSPGHKESHVEYVSADGIINTAGTKACLLARAIRPAFYLNVSSCEDLTIQKKQGDQDG